MLAKLKLLSRPTRLVKQHVTLNAQVYRVQEDSQKKKQQGQSERQAPKGFPAEATTRAVRATCPKGFPEETAARAG